MPKDKKYIPPEQIAELEENMATLVNLITANVSAMGGNMMSIYFTGKDADQPGVVLIGVGASAISSVQTFIRVLNQKNMANTIHESPRPN